MHQRQGPTGTYFSNRAGLSHILRKKSGNGQVWVNIPLGALSTLGYFGYFGYYLFFEVVSQMSLESYT